MAAGRRVTEAAPTRQWRGRPLCPYEEMLMFHSDQGPVPETLRHLQERLESAGIGYVVIGAFALRAHNVSRATQDVDICVRLRDLEQFQKRFGADVYERVADRPRRFRDMQTGVTIDFLVSGDLAGRKSRNKQIRFPDPAEALNVGGLPTVTLPRLIELKLVTWRLKDWADVVALIRANILNEAFADKLDPLVRMAYLECYDSKVEEDKYDRET